MSRGFEDPLSRRVTLQKGFFSFGIKAESVWGNREFQVFLPYQKRPLEETRRI